MDYFQTAHGLVCELPFLKKHHREESMNCHQDSSVVVVRALVFLVK
jgi:hypothetical protein